MKVNADIYCLHSASSQSPVKESREFTTRGGEALLHNITTRAKSRRAGPETDNRLLRDTIRAQQGVWRNQSRGRGVIKFLSVWFLSKHNQGMSDKLQFVDQARS
jgi:hypothetical protein